MPRYELNLRESTTDLEIIIRHVVWSSPSKFCDSLWTKFSPCRKELKLSEYITSIEVNMNQVISAVSGSY